MKHKLNALILALISAALLQGCATTKLNGPPDMMFKEGGTILSKRQL